MTGESHREAACDLETKLSEQLQRYFASGLGCAIAAIWATAGFAAARLLVRRPDVDEVDIHAVDLGHELRHCVELRLGLAPVVLGSPVARERLDLHR